MKLRIYSIALALISSSLCYGAPLTTAKHVGSGVAKSVLSLGCGYVVLSALVQSIKLGSKHKPYYQNFTRTMVESPFDGPLFDGGFLSAWTLDLGMIASLLSVSFSGSYVFGKGALQSFKSAYKGDVSEQSAVEERVDKESTILE